MSVYIFIFTQLVCSLLNGTHPFFNRKQNAFHERKSNFGKFPSPRLISYHIDGFDNLEI